MAPTVVNFSPSFFADCLVALSSLVQTYDLVPHVFDSSFVFIIGIERFDWKEMILWTCVLYTYNKLR